MCFIKAILWSREHISLQNKKTTIFCYIKLQIRKKETIFFPIVLVSTNYHFKETCDNTSLVCMSQKSGSENKHGSERQGDGATLLLPAAATKTVGTY